MAVNGFRSALVCSAILGLTCVPANAMELDDLFSPVSIWLDETASTNASQAIAPPESSALTFHGSIAQYYNGVIDGGRREKWKYAGTGNYNIGVDFGKLGIQEGLSLTALAAHRWGNPLTVETGALIPPAIDTLVPAPTYDLVLYDLYFTQAISESLAIIAGKMDLLDGDMNPFASGRGRTGFLNTSMLLPVNGVPTLPLSTLGAGAVFMKEGTPFGKLLVLNSSDTATTSGFDELFDDGFALVGALTVPVPLFGKFGIQSLLAAYNNKTFTSIGQDPRVILPGVPLSPTKASWFVSWSCAYYFQQFDPEHDPMKGWGVFARIGASDAAVNPISHWVNLGIGGNSPLHGRHNDRFGFGWFYNGLSSDLGPLAQIALMPKSYSTGMELFYNFAVNDHLFITPDLQIVSPGIGTSDTATIAGVRVEVVL